MPEPLYLLIVKIHRCKGMDIFPTLQIFPPKKSKQAFNCLLDVFYLFHPRLKVAIAVYQEVGGNFLNLIEF